MPESMDLALAPVEAAAWALVDSPKAKSFGISRSRDDIRQPLSRFVRARDAADRHGPTRVSNGAGRVRPG
jgi:hypothetical protein